MRTDLARRVGLPAEADYDSVEAHLAAFPDLPRLLPGKVSKPLVIWNAALPRPGIVARDDEH